MGMDPDVINFDDLPTETPLPKTVAPQGLPDVIGFDDLPDEVTASAPRPTQAAMVQPEAPGMLAGAGSAVVRGYQDDQVNSGIAEKFRLRGYKTSLENGGDFESDIGELIMSGKATPAQSDLFQRRVPQSDPVWRAAEIARVTNEMGKLDQSIKDSAATIQNYSGKSQPYQDLQAANQLAVKEGRPVMGTLENLWDNPAGIPEFVAEGAYGTAKPIAGAIGAAIALRRGQAAPLAQTLGPIGVSMGITGVDSYKGQVAEMIEEKAREGGIDLRKTPEKMDDLLQDANFIEAVKSDALKAGINDAAWAGISTWLGMTPRIKGIWQPIVQSGAESLTSISQDVVLGKKINAQNAIMSGVAGAMFEGPSYGIARAADAFGKPDAPAAPAAGQQQTTTPPPDSPNPQAQPQATAPDTINVDDLPSVAGETVAPVEAPAPAPAQPQAEAPAPAPAAQPAPVAEPVAVQPEPVAPVAEVPAPAATSQPAAPAPVAVEPEATPAPAAEPVATAQPAPSAAYTGGDPKADPRFEGLLRNQRSKVNVLHNDLVNDQKKRERAVAEKRSTKNLDARIAATTAEIESALAKVPADKVKPVQPAAAPAPVAQPAVQPVAQAEPAPAPTPAPAPVAQPAAQPAVGNVEPAPVWPGDRSPIAKRNDWSAKYREWRAKHAKTHFEDGTPRVATTITGPTAQPNVRTDAENTAPQSPQAEAAPAAEAAPVEQPKAPEPAPAEETAPTEKEKEKAPVTDENGEPVDTRKKQVRRVETTGKEPPQVEQARRDYEANNDRDTKAKRDKHDAAGRIIDQFEHDQRLAQYDPATDLSAVSDDALTEFMFAHDDKVKFNEAEGYETPQSDLDFAREVQAELEARAEMDATTENPNLMRTLLNVIRGLQSSEPGIGLPSLDPAYKAERYNTLRQNITERGRGKRSLFRRVPGQNPSLASKDYGAGHRADINAKADGWLERIAGALAARGYTQFDPSENSSWYNELVEALSNPDDVVPAGGILGASDIVTNAQPRLYSPTVDEGSTGRAIDAALDRARTDAVHALDDAVLTAGEQATPTESGIIAALDKAAAERLDPRNANSLGPDLVAALMWQTARDLQKGVVSFAKWSADMARKFPSLKGSLKAIWAKAQDIAKRPMDYIRFRALDSIADKVWQNASRNKASATLRKIANIVFAKGGPDADATENDIPTRINLVRNQFSNIYANIMERFAAEFRDMTPEQRRQWDKDFRAAVIDGTTPSDPKVAQAVKDFRNLMRDMLAYQRNAGIEMGDQGGNYFPRNYDADAVEADRDGFVAAAQEMYRKREERLLNKAIADVRRAEKDRPAERRAADRKFGRKEKTDAEYRQEAAEWAQEKIAALEAEFAAKDDDFYKQKAEDWATAITHGDVLGMTLFKTSEGKVTSDSTDARTFTNEEAKLADDFLKKNIDDIMMGYIDGAVRGAEVGRIFGQDGSKFEQMMNHLSKEGVDAETIKETRRLVQKALGVGREQQSQATAAFFDWVNVVLAGAFLGKTFVYNLVLEPISFGIRTGNAYLALKSMADTWRLTLAELGTPSPATRQRIEAKYGSQAAFAKSVTETVAEQVGLIQNEMERAYFNAHWDYSSDEKGSKLAKWISQRIYRANLMSATEKAKVQASIGIARLALSDNARFLTGDAPIQKLFKALGFDVNADKSAAVIMRENGVPDADHKAFAAWVAGLEGKTDAEWQKAVMDPKETMAKHYRRALQRMSLGMSIKTNPALKMEMSDSILGRMLMQLMNYSYAYSNLVKDRMYSMAAATVAKDASTIDRLRYAAPLLVGAPLAIMGAAASKALIAGLWPSDDEEKRSKETPMVRKAFNWASFAGMFGPKVEYLFKSFERGQAPGGPVGETIFRGGQAVFSAAGDPDSEKKAFNAKKQLYNSTVKPVVTGVGAAAHPFFGFLGNAAVNNQDVREAVTGQAPRK